MVMGSSLVAWREIAVGAGALCENWAPRSITATLPAGLKPPRFTSLSAARKGYTQPNPLGFF